MAFVFVLHTVQHDDASAASEHGTSNKGVRDLGAGFGEHRELGEDATATP